MTGYRQGDSSILRCGIAELSTLTAPEATFPDQLSQILVMSTLVGRVIACLTNMQAPYLTKVFLMVPEGPASIKTPAPSSPISSALLPAFPPATLAFF